jgi:hypothetical protein
MSLAYKPQSNSPAPTLSQAPAPASLLSTLGATTRASCRTRKDLVMLASMLSTVKRKGSPRAPRRLSPP